MRLGFIGTGRISTALVEGFCTTPDPPTTILVSPRNAERAARLAARFPQVTVAKDNQAVLDGCEYVFLALRPPMVSVLGEVRFRPEQQIISLMPTRPYTQIAEFVEPAKRLAWALPLPSVARHVGPIAVFPGESSVVNLLARVGQTLVAPDLEQLRILWSSTALIAPFYALIDETTQWATVAGADRQIAGPYVAAMFHALAVLAREIPDGLYSNLVADAATPGGFNEQALTQIREHGGYRAFLEALDSILTRLGGAPPNRPQSS